MHNLKILWPCRNIGPRCTVSSEFDCRSRGHEFIPGLIPNFCGDWSWNHFYGHSPPLADSWKAVISYKYVHKVLVNHLLVKLAQMNWPSRHDHSCWLGRKTSNQPTKTWQKYLMTVNEMIYLECSIFQLTSHMQELLNTAYSKFDVWQSRRLTKKSWWQRNIVI